ncbi:MAG: M66 family metalloprotease, partial [Chthoniobacteraceae bacterium]
TGNMRQSIGKELISHGIDNANYGLNSTSGRGERSHPYVAAQLAAHNNRGKYSNGIQVHGGSGGGGIVTLDQSLGNEFSHEVGHNYGLGHYVDGFKGSVHRPADQINSTWGWDADKGRFIPNFAPTRSGKETCVEKECQPPFDGRSFGLDAMAGGAPLSGFNRFTLYTPNTAAIIQRFLESKAVFDASSPTGFSKWNDSTSRMEPYRHSVDVSREANAPIKELDEARLTALLAENDVVTIAMSDGNWTREIPLPRAAAANRGRVVMVDHNAGYSSVLLVNGKEVNVTRGFKKSYTSDGKRWSEGAAAERRGLERKPQHFGVPVVTLVGYYDPTGQQPTYIYPALHGSYGFCYADDSSTIGEADCQLVVETRTGVLRFRLASSRLGGPYMNKFHVNVPASSQPRSAAVISRGKVLDKKPIAPLTEKLSLTVNGIPVASNAAAPATIRAGAGVVR